MKNSILLLALLIFFTEGFGDHTRQIPTSYAGRFQPLSVYARHWLYEISHQNHLSVAQLQESDSNALSFLWQLHFFGHFDWHDEPIFWIGHADLKERLALPIKAQRFSFRQLKAKLSAHAELQTLDRERYKDLLEELERVSALLSTFEQLQGSALSMANSDFKQAYLKLKMEHLPPPEIAVQLEMAFPLAMRLKQAGEILKILPGKFKNGEWFSPHAFHAEVYNQKTATLELIGNFTLYPEALFQTLRQSYFAWENAVLEKDRPAERHWEGIFTAQLLEGYDTLASKPHLQASGKYLSYPSKGQLMAEEIYFHTPLVSLCSAIYAAAALFLLVSYRLKKTGFARGGIILATAGFLLHTTVLCMRTYILGRPPVTNMLETVLYVPWVSVAVGLLLSLLMKQAMPLMAATVASTILLMILNMSYLGERFENLQAVLDSQYWLIIHVLMVVGSYGIFILSAILGHFYLGLTAFRKEMPTNTATESPQQRELARAILQTIYLGTLLLIGGTLLGGVWAAESWGRFWDWDPKESWAFISICIYLLWIHAYRFHKIGNFGLAIGSILGVLMISFTWYGVNYILGTGLHSYGFGKGGQWIYYSYLYAELLFVTTMTTVAWRRGFLGKKLAKNSNSMV